MKSLLVLVAALSLSFSAIAQDRRGGGPRADGRIELNNGQAIIRINVGDERNTDTREMMKRIAQLERAVRELQNRVYDLEDDARPQTREVKIFTCISTSNFGEKAPGTPALTELEARSNAITACTKIRMPMFCEERNVRCESRIEYQRI